MTDLQAMRLHFLRVHAYDRSAVLYLTNSAGGCIRRAGYAAAALGLDEFGSDLLLVALSADSTVAGAMGSVGVQRRALWTAVFLSHDDDALRDDNRGSVGGLPDPRLRRPSAEASALMADAEAAAASREHFWCEPGHLLLAILQREQSHGYRLLDAITDDVARVCDYVERALPAEEDSEEALVICLQRYLPLPTEETRRLAHDLAFRNQTLPLLRIDPERLTEEQRVQLDARRRLPPNPGLRLHRHHVHVVMQAANERAQAGHRLNYAFNIAEQAQLRATTRFIDPHEPFADFARRAIDAELQRRFA